MGKEAEGFGRHSLESRAPPLRVDPKPDVEALQKELRHLGREVDVMSRNFPIPEVEKMRDGMPRPGAGPLENEIRRRYARIRDIERTLDAIEKEKP